MNSILKIAPPPPPLDDWRKTGTHAINSPSDVAPPFKKNKNRLFAKYTPKKKSPLPGDVKPPP